MSYIRRMNLLLVSMIIASMVLAACGGGGAAPTATSGAQPTTAASGAEPTAASGAEPTAATGAEPTAATEGSGAGGGAELIFWTRAPEDSPEGPILREVIQACADETGNKVEVQVVPDDQFRNKLSLAAPVGEGPDLGGPIAHDWIGELVVQEIALEVPQDRLTDHAAYSEAALQGFSVEGKLYGVPLFVESVALIWNKDLAGEEPPATFEELVEKSKELTEGDQYGFVMPILEQYHMYSFLTGYGGYIFKYDPATGYDINDIGLATEGSVKGVNYIKELVEAGIMPAGVLDRTNQHNVSTGAMEAGKAAFTINGPWTIDGLKKNNINYGIAPIPALPDGDVPKPFLGIQGFFASAYSEHPEQALDVLNCLGSEEAIVKLSQGYNKVPARADALDDPAFADNTDFQAWAAQAENAVPMPNIPEMGQVWKPWGDALDVAVPGTAPVDEAMSTAVEQVAAAIEQFRK